MRGGVDTLALPLRLPPPKVLLRAEATMLAALTAAEERDVDGALAAAAVAGTAPTGRLCELDRTCVGRESR